MLPGDSDAMDVSEDSDGDLDDSDSGSSSDDDEGGDARLQRVLKKLVNSSQPNASIGKAPKSSSAVQINGAGADEGMLTTASGKGKSAIDARKGLGAQGKEAGKAGRGGKRDGSTSKKAKGPKPEPDSFSRMDLSLPEKVLKSRFPRFPGKKAAVECEVAAGQMLYLPAGWFHEASANHQLLKDAMV